MVVYVLSMTTLHSNDPPMPPLPLLSIYHVSGVRGRRYFPRRRAIQKVVTMAHVDFKLTKNSKGTVHSLSFSCSLCASRVNLLSRTRRLMPLRAEVPAWGPQLLKQMIEGTLMVQKATLRVCKFEKMWCL